MTALNRAPLRTVTGREVLASRERLYLACGHSLERAWFSFASRARCAECATQERSPRGQHPEGF